MACSFAVRCLAFLSLLFSSLDHYSWADTDFLFEKGNLWSKKKTTKNHDDSRTGIGWMEQNTAAYMCDNADAWFYMEPFKIVKAHRIFVEIEYKLKPNDSCLDSDCGLYLQSRKGTDATKVLDQTFSPDPPKIKAAQTRTVYSAYFDLKYNKEYLQLAIQAKGVCTTVFNISVYYYFCPRNVSSSGSLVLERTPAPKEGSVSVSANCREGSDFSGSPSAECFSNGTWKTFTTQQHLCRCSAGQVYKNGTGCTPCPDNYYKRDEHTRCEPCPENSRSRSGSSRCACNKTYYWHGKTGSCRKIPSNPRNLTYTVLEHNQIKLQWVKPVDSAKHEDLRYMVVCKPCGDLSIGDEGNNLNETHLIIQNIRNDTKYIFTVFALNGFSNQGSQKDWCQAIIDIQINGSSPGIVVRA